MAYIGNQLATQFQAFVTQTITGDGSTGYTLDRAVANGKELLVYINNVKQEEGSGKSYTASGTTITFSAAVASTDSCYVVFLGSAVQTITAPDSSIVSGQIANATLVLPNKLDMNGNELILDADADTSITADTDDQIDVRVSGSDVVTVTSSSVSFAGDVTVLGDDLTVGDDTGDSELHLISATDSSGRINFGDSGDADIGVIQYEHDGNNMVFKTLANERMRIDSSGNVIVSNTSLVGTGNNTAGHIELREDGTLVISRNAGVGLAISRGTDDGEVVQIQQAGTKEGDISVSGSTVSFNGFTGLHESSGIATNTAKGTILSTIDELDVYSDKQTNIDTEEDNPKAGQTRVDHPKVKVSDTVSDSAVYGVVGSFNPQGKVMVASVGIGSIRVTGACAKGDLLESNGDGTAKVQSDDIVRSKTIGKVTIGNSSTDVKLVSCVLYCG